MVDEVCEKMTIDRRKDDHIEICLTKDVRTSYDHWNDVHLIHQAIPKCDLDEIDMRTKFLGKELSVPLVIAAMTGGSQKAGSYNRDLAKAAEEFGIGLGVGSQRAGLEKKEYENSYSVVKEFSIPLVLANLGAPQFANSENRKVMPYGVGEVESAIEMVGGDAVCIHFNYLQEVVQPEGDTKIRGVMDGIREVSRRFKVVGKETGAGISREAALLLKEAGAAALDVGGASGTSFSAVESYRTSGKDGTVKSLGTTYWNWGIPTPISIKMSQVGLPIIATGGLRNGLDVVKALALGADLGGMAWPLLKPASRGYDELKKEIEGIIQGIKVGMFLSGASGSMDVRNVRSVLTGKTGELLAGLYE